MIFRATESQFIRLFFKGLPAFVVVLVVGFFSYIYALKHEIEAASNVKYLSRVDIIIGTRGEDKPTIKFSSLEERLREEIPGPESVKVPNPEEEPNNVEVVAQLPNDELYAIVEAVVNEESRLTERSEEEIQDDMNSRLNLLNHTTEELDALQTSPAIESAKNAEAPEAIMAVPYFLNELIALHQELENTHPTQINPVYEKTEGGITARNVWGTLSAIIGSLGIIYFATISGLAFGYILDSRQ